MLKEKIIQQEELRNFGSTENLNEKAKALVAQQKATWELAAKNYDGLNRIQTRTFYFNDFQIEVQFNPERIRSSAAKTDAKSIAERPCFLCPKNLPPEQKGIPFQDNYIILTNPFPIFPTHLTIPRLEHTPQQISEYFADMLELSRELNDFTVFYNGPQTGASAPDHFHFQAGIKGLLPVENELENLKKNHSEILLDENDATVFAVENYLRRFVSIQSEKKEKLQKIFRLLFERLPSNDESEPLLNVLCNFENGKCNVLVFPRKKRRPTHFYRTDEKQIIVSPASVELGGVLILPRKEDFEKMTKEILSEIFSEVIMGENDFRNFVEEIKTLLNE